MSRKQMSNETGFVTTGLGCGVGGELPAIDHQRGADALTLTKAHTWSHENEWRYAPLLPVVLTR